MDDEMTDRIEGIMDFLSEVWYPATYEKTATPGWVFIATSREQAGWREAFFPLHEGQFELISKAVETALKQRLNLYFTPRVFDAPARSIRTATASSVLYADLDTGEPIVEPTYMWNTSEGNRQCVWFCQDNLPPVEHSRLNKALTYLSKADRGGWHGSKLLRVPGSYNLKRGEWTEQVELVYPTLEYPASRFRALAVGYFAGAATRGIDIPQEISLPENEDQWRLYIQDNWERIPEHILSALLSRTTDRSLRIWVTAKDCKRAGLSVEEAVILIWGAEWNKWRHKPSELYRNVAKAYYPGK